MAIFLCYNQAIAPSGGKHKSGADVARPTKYKPEFKEQAEKLCALGAKDTQISNFFKVTEKTLNNWKHKHPEFLQSLKKGKLTFDTETVVNSLLHRALGYQHKEDKILANPKNPNEPIVVETTKHYPPDTTACIFWLKNRLPEDWRDRPEGMGNPDRPIHIEIINPYATNSAD